jgi:hypothetical protein
MPPGCAPRGFLPRSCSRELAPRTEVVGPDSGHGLRITAGVADAEYGANGTVRRAFHRGGVP